MSGVQPEKRRGRKGKAVCALLLATSIFALLRPSLVYAQETALRGEVSESAILSDQQRKARELALAGQGQAAPANATTQDSTRTYLPASAGAIPDTDAASTTASIFDPPAATDDTSADTPASPKRRHTAAAKQRAADQN
jgi:hypothetical protein